MNYRDVFLDIITHADDFKNAIKIAREHAEVDPPEIDDKAYWDKQLRTYKNIEKLAKLMMGEDEFVPTGETSRAKFDSIYDNAYEKMKTFKIFGIDTKYQIQSMSAAEQVAMAYGDFYYQVGNGGIAQYIGNGYAIEAGKNGRQANSILSGLTISFKDEDPEFATLLTNMLRETRRHLDISEYSEGRHDETTNTVFDPLEMKLYAFDEERVFKFFLAAAEGLNQKRRPFIEGIEKAEPESTMKM